MAKKSAKQKPSLPTKKQLPDLLKNAMESMQIGVTITDMNGRILYTNPAEAQMHGYNVEDLLGKDARIFAPRELWKGMTVDQVKELKSWKRESVNIREDGVLFSVQIISDVILDPKGNPIGMITLCEDITDRKKWSSTFYDRLTSLPSRDLLLDRLGRSLKRIKRRTDYLFALLFLDIDRFKSINDRLGTDMGDRLLIACARRMESCVRFGDTVSHLGGDEFVILLEDIRGMEDAGFVAQRILDQVAMPFALEDHELSITVSVGIAEAAAGYDRPEDILRDASTAMYRAKSLGRARFEVFERTLQSRAMAMLPLEIGLRRAMERQELFLEYQPVISLENDQIDSIEALVRWRHPDRGVVHPEEFIPVAEETGLMASMGEWILKTACSQNKSWQRAGLSPVTVAVNLSAIQLQQKDFIEMVLSVLKDTDLNPRYLELQFAEGMITENFDHFLPKLRQLKEIGIKLSIDDFGTGQSSLNYLQRFSIDAIRLDHSFVRDMSTNPKEESVVNAMIALAHSLGMKVIAEGIETEEELQFLRWHHCDLAQGNYFSPAIPAETLGELFHKTQKIPT